MDEQPIIDITAEEVGPAPGLRNGQEIEAFLGRRRRLFLSFFLLALASFAIWIWIRPPRYRAAGTILIARTGPVPAPVAESELASEIELIRAQGPPPGASGVVPGIRSLGKSNVIEISAMNADERTAALAVNRTMDLYLQERYRLMLAQTGLISVESEAHNSSALTEATRAELEQLERNARGPAVEEELKERVRRVVAAEGRISELRGALRGQEEVLKRSAGEPVELRITELRAQVNEAEQEYRRLKDSTSRLAIAAAKRNALARDLQTAQGKSEYLSRRLQDSKIAESPLQARIISRANLEPTRSVDWPWWGYVLALLGAMFAAGIATGIVDLIDRPVMTGDDFARVTGTPASICSAALEVDMPPP